MSSAYISILNERVLADPRPSLQCARTIPAAECSPAPLRIQPIAPRLMVLRSRVRISLIPVWLILLRRRFRNLADLSFLSASWVLPLSQPASSNPDKLIEDGPLIDVSAPALCTGVNWCAPERSCWCPAEPVIEIDYSWQAMSGLLAGGLVTCDWLRPVTWDAWLMAPPFSVAAHTAVSCLGCSGWWMCLWITCAYLRSVEVLLLTWTHVLLIFLCYCLTEL